MFIRCKLLLSQNTNSVEVMLDRPISGVFRDVVTFWGNFSSSEGGIPPERKQWLYAQGKWELTLMDAGGPGVGMVGGGLSFGELASLPPSATLFRARLSPRGVEPIESSGIGAGEVMNASDISVRFHGGRMAWQLLAFQNPGSNAWVNP